MKRISIDNGNSFTTTADVILKIDWDFIVLMMDDDTREYVSSYMSPCTKLEFLKEYLNKAKSDLIIG